MHAARIERDYLDGNIYHLSLRAPHDFRPRDRRLTLLEAVRRESGGVLALTRGRGFKFIDIQSGSDGDTDLHIHAVITSPLDMESMKRRMAHIRRTTGWNARILCSVETPRHFANLNRYLMRKSVIGFGAKKLNPYSRFGFHR